MKILYRITYRTVAHLLHTHTKICFFYTSGMTSFKTQIQDESQVLSLASHFIVSMLTCVELVILIPQVLFFTNTYMLISYLPHSVQFLISVVKSFFYLNNANYIFYKNFRMVKLLSYGQVQFH